MSEQAPESGGSLDEAFSKKYGPLTGLQWTLVAAGAGGIYIWYRGRHQGTGSSSASGATAYGYTGQPYDYGPSIAALQSEVQGLQAGAPGGTGTSTPPTNTGTSTHTDSGGSNTPSAGPASPLQYTGPKTSLADATAYLQSQGYNVTNVSLGGQNLTSAQIQAQQGTAVYSVTPYSNKTARIGLQ